MVDYGNFTDDAGTTAIWQFMLLDNYGDLKPLNRQHLPFYSELGSYPILYLTKGGSDLCADCATKALYQLAEEFDPPIAHAPYYEGPPINCDDCNREIESAYGDPEEEN